MRDGDQLRPARDLSEHQRRRRLRTGVTDVSDPQPRRRCQERPEQPEVLDVGRDDLVLLGEPEPGENDVARVRRRGDESDALRRHLEHAGHGHARLLAQGQSLLEVSLPASALLEVPPVPLRHRLDRRPRERPVRAGVQVGIAFEDRKLGPRFFERHAAVASTGV